MTFEVNNQLWKIRSKHGRGRIYNDVDSFLKACMDYFQWVDDHPLQEEKIFHNAGEVTRANVSKMRAMTMEGLWLFIGISRNTWKSYKLIDDFLPVIEVVENIIWEQKFTGAAADMLNSNIIARDLGLRDNVVNEVNPGDEFVKLLREEAQKSQISETDE